jgi:glycosyltransferase involved in cell wall biosynthesis
VPLLKERDIEIDLLAGRFNQVTPEQWVITAGSFSPFSSALVWLSRLKNRLTQGSPAGNKNVGLRSAKIEFSRISEVTKDNSLRSLISSFEVFPDQDSGWILPAIRAALRQRHAYDFVVSTAPPWSSHIAGIYIGRRLRLPVILDDRDPWVGSLGRMVFITHPIMRRLDGYLANRCYSRAAGIACVTKAARDFHRERLSDCSIPIEYLPNGYDPNLNQSYHAPNRTSELTITYVGSLYYHGRSPMIILEAAKALDEAVARNLHFHFVGKIFQSEADAINALDKKFKVTLHGLQSHEYCLRAVSESDVCFLMAIGQPMQIPAKVYEYIGLGRPILSVSDANDATMQLLKNKNWARTVAAGDTVGLTRALADIHKLWKKDNLPLLKPDEEREEHSFERIAEGYAEFIRKVIQNTRSGAYRKT